MGMRQTEREARDREIRNEIPEEVAQHDAVYLLRTTQQHHVQLSAMADQKAGFLIGGSIVLLGLVLGQLGGEQSLGLLAAGFTALVTLSLAIFAVMPRFSGKTLEPGTTPNTLFFGVFAHINEEEWIDRHLEMLNDATSVRRAMLRDIHQMGSDLYRTKFRYLSYAFRVAFVGFAFSFAVALIEFIAG
jgi:hypothetical protein